MTLTDNVHCCACLKNGNPVKGLVCRYCGSEDIFTAKDLIQGDVERATNDREAELRGFILDEWKRLERAAKK